MKIWGLFDPLVPKSHKLIGTKKKVIEEPKQAFDINLSESLILAQDERWRRASYMQVERTDFG